MFFEILRVTATTCTGLALTLVGMYGLGMTLVANGPALCQPLVNVGLWLLDLANGTLNKPPVLQSALDTELTCIASSILPLLLLGAGGYLLRGPVCWFRRI